MNTIIVSIFSAVAFISLATAVTIIEGDIAVDSNLIATITGQTNAYEGRVNGHWPGGVVPYTFEQGFSSEKKKLVAEAIAEYRKYTCVKLVPRTNQKDYAVFINDAGCYSYIGKTGGRQNISIGDGCQKRGIVIHEIMHAIGFYHEQSRLDRDNYINIKWENIRSTSTYNFKKYARGRADFWGEKYDLKSIMQYGNYAFSKNAEKTIEVKGDPHRIIGQRDGFSQSDARQINNMYKCGKSRPTPKTVTIPICKDTKALCSVWKKIGHCQSNRGYMVRGCPMSCGLCPNGKTLPPVTAAPVPRTPSKKTTPKGTCGDRYSGCKSMVAKGQCGSNPRYMLKWCRKSCKFCSVPTTCRDMKGSCSAWTIAGHCKKNPYYMVKYCTKSCKFCY